MLSNFAILACSALIPVVTAQLPALPFNMSYTPDLSPAKVPLATKAEWCRGETIVCDKLCSAGGPAQIPTKNDCSSDTLAFSCICQNGTAPGLQYYQNSLPSFICEETFKQCEAARAGDARGQEDCKTGVKSKCGTQSADKATSGGGSNAATTTSATPSATQGGSQGAATSATKPGSAATQVPQIIGMAAAAAVMGAFAL